MRPPVSILLLFVLTASVFPQQLSHSAWGVSGFVQKAAFVEIEPTTASPEITLQAIARDRSRVSARLASTSGGSSQAVVRLLLRSNAPFELRGMLINTPASLSVKASVQSVYATGPGVRAGAAEGTHSKTLADAVNRDELIALSGPRISAGGSYSSPANALVIEIKVDAESAAAWSADLQFTIKPV